MLLGCAQTYCQSEWLREFLGADRINSDTAIGIFESLDRSSHRIGDDAMPFDNDCFQITRSG